MLKNDYIEVREKDRVGVAHSGKQAKGVVAFCELSHILQNFNEHKDKMSKVGKLCMTSLTTTTN
jgi:hypothetical protein